MSQAHAATERPAATDLWKAARSYFDSIISQLQSPPTQTMSHSEVENLIGTEGRELQRLLYQAHLDQRAPGKVDRPVIDAQGVEQTHQRSQTRGLKTLFGTVRVRRTGYGGRGRASLHPLDAQLNLPPESYSHPVRRCVAETTASQAYEQVMERVSRLTGETMPVRQCEELVKRAAQDFEAFYEQQPTARAAEVRASGRILVLTSDGKGIVMRPEELSETTRAEAERCRLHLGLGLRTRGVKAGTKKMSTVAAVYTIEPYLRTAEQIVSELKPVRETQPKRPRPEDKRVWASLERPMEEVIEEAFEEARRRDPRGRKKWVALVDGNETQLSLMHCAAKEYHPQLVIILDLIHVLEYVWKAARDHFQEGDRQAAGWVGERLLEILRGRSSLVAAGIRRSATLRGLEAEQRVGIDKCADYLLKYREYLRYDQYLAEGYPIASGVIEGACRHLIRDRMELTGARWSVRGAEAVLRLRALKSSGDFDAYWGFHLKQEYQRHHASRYADRKAPVPNEPREKAVNTGRLKLVS